MSTGRPRRRRCNGNDWPSGRIAVGKAIRRAIDHVGAADRVIGEHLHHTLRTGTRCSYLPA